MFSSQLIKHLIDSNHTCSLIGNISDFFQVGRRSPTFRVGICGNPDVPPPRASDLDELYGLVLSQIDFPRGQGHVVGQDEVTVAGSMPRHSSSTLAAATQVSYIFSNLKFYKIIILNFIENSINALFKANLFEVSK